MLQLAVKTLKSRGLLFPMVFFEFCWGSPGVGMFLLIGRFLNGRTSTSIPDEKWMETLIWHLGYPLVNCYIAIEAMAIEIVDLPS